VLRPHFCLRFAMLRSVPVRRDMKFATQISSALVIPGVVGGRRIRSRLIVG
jgi:hypothetical protein